MKEDGIPLRRVMDSSFVAAKVAATLMIIISVRTAAESSDESAPPPIMKNIDITDMSIGNLPLQGIKLLVRTASSLSRGESIMRQPTTPAALQPKPIHIVSACLPQALHRLKGRSRL